MTRPLESVTFSIPRSVVTDLPSLSDELTERMHELLERNTEGALNAMERGELETLVRMAQFAQILTMATRGATAQ